MRGAILSGASDSLPIVLVLGHSDLAGRKFCKEKRMVIPEKTMSAGGQHALQDMIELELYLTSQSQQKPWPLLPRRNKKLQDAGLSSKLVSASAAAELINLGFIEPSSSRTYIVSKGGYRFYKSLHTMSPAQPGHRHHEDLQSWFL